MLWTPRSGAVTAALTLLGLCAGHAVGFDRVPADEAEAAERTRLDPEISGRASPVQRSAPPSIAFAKVEETPAPPESVAGPERTPLSKTAAARHLKAAWATHTNKELLPRGLAILLAHWALETGRGEYMMNNNFAGLKGTAPSGGAVELWTREHSAGQAKVTRERFRAYVSAQAGADDYVRLLRQRYPDAFQAVRDGDVVAFVRELKRKDYFTEDSVSYEAAMRSLWFEYASRWSDCGGSSVPEACE